MSIQEHKALAPEKARCMIVTVSDTRNEDTDKSGKLIRSLLTEHNHDIRDYKIVKDDEKHILEAARMALINDEMDAVIFNGGTGIAQRDVTIEALSTLFEKEITGFGELFRMLSYREDIGSAAMLSRAVAGVRGKTVIFALPGSSGAVKLGMEKLILPELTHIIQQLYK
ncbi:MogA/MoaB family molybdenum cofactor biosynthesis protein [Fictibacillus phosphorivorans]|uniref:MogA/MoaB family molybdenum cofactor biosynthesis protein n=1 Tax=Fictibacillus phosphorivorans TaxID=1221500 RepID=UPI00203A58AD|nr:molybdenum cofactor biosynthesis protein B [Fictibacillus phosphorivorans]MCM3717938.1 molybdenum cofactor biosynthesis protein MoaB [Fictibacillus phosphorivorans]MCM3775387.1 molybdenum cofactor biosynthesis protein MoaB [Fictibacillus phosphorivorans]